MMINGFSLKNRKNKVEMKNQSIVKITEILEDRQPLVDVKEKPMSKKMTTVLHSLSYLRPTV